LWGETGGKEFFCHRGHRGHREEKDWGKEEKGVDVKKDPSACWADTAPGSLGEEGEEKESFD